MADIVVERLLNALRQADALYNRLVLLVGPSGAGKTDALKILAEETNTSVINVNLVLSRRLLELTAKQRSLRLPEILRQLTKDAPAPLLLDNLEMLFDQDLHQDPLRLLASLSRNRPVVAVWNGTFSDGRLSYAESGHPEYRYYDAIDALIVCMGSTAGCNWDGAKLEEA